MKKKDKNEFKVHTYGYDDEDILNVSVLEWESGKCKDGISFAHNDEGCWLVSFKDLMKIVELAKAYRGIKDIPCELVKEKQS